MEEFEKALNYLKDNPSIESINDSSKDYDSHVMSELYDRGLINGVDCRSKSGVHFLEPRISLSGLEWLEERAKISDSKSEDIFDVKPNFMGVGLNLNAFFRWFKRKT